MASRVVARCSPLVTKSEYRVCCLAIVFLLVWFGQSVGPGLPEPGSGFAAPGRQPPRIQRLAGSACNLLQSSSSNPMPPFRCSYSSIAVKTNTTAGFSLNRYFLCGYNDAIIDTSLRLSRAFLAGMSQPWAGTVQVCPHPVRFEPGSAGLAADRASQDRRKAACRRGFNFAPWRSGLGWDCSSG